MKKQKNKTIISMAAILIIFGACQKEELTELNIKKNTISPKSQETQAIVIPTEDYTDWDYDKKECVKTTDYICCSPPAPDPASVQLQLYSDFETAFNNNSISDFFTNYAYYDLWPSLSTQSTIINDLINGTNRMIMVHNSTNNIDYYLIGDASLTDTQIESNPLWVVYVNW